MPTISYKLYSQERTELADANLVFTKQLSEIINKALEKTTDLRPTTATDLQQLFDSKLVSKTIVGRNPLKEEYYVKEKGNLKYKFSLKYGRPVEKQYKHATPPYLEVKQQIDVTQRHKG